MLDGRLQTFATTTQSAAEITDKYLSSAYWQLNRSCKRHLAAALPQKIMFLSATSGLAPASIKKKKKKQSLEFM